MMNELLKIWREAKSATDYIVALWITVLAATFGIGMIAILYRLISDPATFRI